MTTAIVLPTLAKWAEQHITRIFQTTNDADTTSALDSFLSDKAAITLNGAQVSRADFINQVQSSKFREASATVTFIGSVQAPTDPNNAFDAGSVGLFYTVEIFEKIRIRDAPVTSMITVSLNLVIAQDPDVPKPPPSPIHGFFDGRRVMSLNEVAVQGPVSSQTAS